MSGGFNMMNSSGGIGLAGGQGSSDMASSGKIPGKISKLK
jgi:hypothetical protein